MSESKSDTDMERRALACKRWRWMPGMRDTHGCRVVDVAHGELRLHDWSTYADPRHGQDYWGTVEVTTISESDVPDLDDPATLGCIEHGLLPAAWPGCAIKVMRYTTPSGAVFADVYVHDYKLPSNERFAVVYVPIGEALIAALEAAP